jgi:hypothetical protein
MNFDLRVEGFAIDDEMREQLMLRCRRVVLGVGPEVPVKATVRQIDGRVQGRVEVKLPGRRVSAVVWRADPIEAMEGAVSAVVDAVDLGREVAVFSGWPEPMIEVSSLQ